MKILKSWGTDGRVVISPASVDPGDLKVGEPVFITFDGLPVPFFLESLEKKGNRHIVKFEDIDSLEAAGEIVGKEACPQSGDLEEEEPSLEGMIVIDAASGMEVGTVTAFDDFSGNTCITVIHKGREVILPLHEDLIRSVDGETGTITLSIPEGLV